MTPYVIVAGLTALALLIVLISFRFADRSRKPKLFRIGSITAASGIMFLWIAIGWVASADWGDWGMPVFIASLLVPVSMLGLGIQLMARACGAREASHNDRLLEDFVRQNDLP